MVSKHRLIDPRQDFHMLCSDNAQESLEPEEHLVPLQHICVLVSTGSKIISVVAWDRWPFGVLGRRPLYHEGSRPLQK
jgi:hypothetical protein